MGEEIFKPLFLGLGRLHMHSYAPCHSQTGLTKVTLDLKFLTKNWIEATSTPRTSIAECS